MAITHNLIDPVTFQKSNQDEILTTVFINKPTVKLLSDLEKFEDKDGNHSYKYWINFIMGVCDLPEIIVNKFSCDDIAIIKAHIESFLVQAGKLASSIITPVLQSLSSTK